ncbi:hypothetical protein V1478_011299 [Vespula squamosa]|uniref:Uncharacterized protein n=1 Tax=Vespula squamosa TaxID=30214 RepID=A0ABD2AGQ5_VESSQ
MLSFYFSLHQTFSSNVERQDVETSNVDRGIFYIKCRTEAPLFSCFLNSEIIRQYISSDSSY